MDFNGTHYINWLEYLDYYRNRKEEYLNKILKQMQYLDVEFVNILNQFISPQIFISLICNYICTGIINTGIKNFVMVLKQLLLNITFFKEIRGLL